jgi:hypothetical protein
MPNAANIVCPIARAFYKIGGGVFAIAKPPEQKKYAPREQLRLVFIPDNERGGNLKHRSDKAD